MAIRKTTIAKNALQQLEAIRELATEGRSWAFHAHSANNYMQAVAAVGWDLPDWIIHNWGFLRAQGWRVDHRAVDALRRA